MGKGGGVWWARMGRGGVGASGVGGGWVMGGGGREWTGPVRSGEVSLRGRAEMPRHQNRANFLCTSMVFRGGRLRLRRGGGGRG